jgi:hypothetical protein
MKKIYENLKLERNVSNHVILEFYTGLDASNTILRETLFSNL